MLDSALQAKNALTHDPIMTEDKREKLLATLNKSILELQDTLNEIPRLKNLAKTYLSDKQLTAARQAIEHFMPGFENLRVQRKPQLQMLVEKRGKPSTSFNYRKAKSL